MAYISYIKTLEEALEYLRGIEEHFEKNAEGLWFNPEGGLDLLTNEPTTYSDEDLILHAQEEDILYMREEEKN